MSLRNWEKRWEENWSGRLPRGLQQHFWMCTTRANLLPYSSCLVYGVQRQDGSLVLREKHPSLAKFCKNVHEILVKLGKMCYDLMQTRLNFLAIYPKGKEGNNTKEHHTHSEGWWWQHHALGLVFFSWGLSQGGGNCFWHKLKMRRNFTFQNDWKHISKSTKEWLHYKRIKVLERPS